MFRNKVFILVSVLIVASMVLAACAPQTVVQTVVVTEEVMVEGETVVQEKVITATPEPMEEKPAFLAADGMVPCLPLPEGMAISHTPVAQTSAPEKASAAKVYGKLEASSLQQAGKVYRVGVFEDVTSLNFFQANGPDNTVWNSYMLPKRLSLYTLADKIFTFVPWVAAELPPPLAEENGKWVTTVKMREDVTWSDGTPLTAADVAFTENAILKFGIISGNFQDWADGNFLEFSRGSGCLQR